MSWYSRDKKTSQIAGEDIPVYMIMLRKPGSGMFWSLYRKEYEPGKVYTTYMDDPLYTKNRMTIRKGFHSYDAKKTEISESRTFWHINPMEVKDVFLDIVGPSDFDDTYEEIVVVECVIPKCACYYENNLGKIVSDQIMVTGNILKRSKIQGMQ